MTEYALLIAIIAGMVFLVLGPLRNLLVAMEQPLRRDFRYIYKYGDRLACGFDDTEDHCSGTPTRHPRYNMPDNLRMFGRGP